MPLCLYLHFAWAIMCNFCVHYAQKHPLIIFVCGNPERCPVHVEVASMIQNVPTWFHFLLQCRHDVEKPVAYGVWLDDLSDTKVTKWRRYLW